MAAFVTTQTNSIEIGGGPLGLLLVTGTFASSAGATGGVIASGYTNATGVFTAVPQTNTSVGSKGGRVIVAWGLNPTTNDATAPGAAKSYNTTLLSDILTIVTDANSTGNYWLLCQTAGA